MARQIDTWKWIAANLQKKVAVVLLYVTESSGSSPGRKGFFMGVSGKAETRGSIGGGIMEHKFIEMAKTRLNGTAGPTLFKQIHDKKASSHQSGMICSGTQTICLYELTQEDLPVLNNLIKTLQAQKRGTLSLSNNAFDFTLSASAAPMGLKAASDSQWTYTEGLGFRNHLFIVGGGHCAQALSQVMDRLDFVQYLLDDRPQLSTMLTNDFVYDKAMVGSYESITQFVQPGIHHYVVIMTQGYRTDYIALKALLKNHYRYIGVLGSKSKIDKMFADLKAEGFSAKQLSQIYAPIGLQIKSETPEEIAISIAAQIIQVKNSRRG